MHELYEIKERLLKELKEYGQQEMSAGNLEVIDKLSHTIKNICKIIEAAEDEEYSQAGGERYFYDEGRGGGGRYYREGRGGNYARGRRGNVRRDSMGRYSREGGYSRADGVEDLVDNMRDMMQELPQHLQQEAQRFMQKLEQSM